MVGDVSERIPTNLRTLLILEELSRSNTPMTASELGRAVGLAKQTVHRLCATLEQEGFLARIAPSKRYIATRRVREMASGLLFSSNSQIAAHQILVDVAREVKETVNFVVPEDSGMRYLDRVETDWAFRVQFPVGSNVPFHCTASGKTYLASLAPRTRRSMVAGLELSKLTHRTHTNQDTLLRELKQISSQGFALDNEEFIDGMVAIAVPVTDAEGRFAAALAFHGPRQRITPDGAINRLDPLLQGAKRIGKALFDSMDVS
ncbi:MAG: IclR family transcriptional regulator [Silicimonas sp.]|nr:IclR family transcriptional regulator [Silicimonas sp.]